VVKTLGAVVPGLLLLPFACFVGVGWWCLTFPRRNVLFNEKGMRLSGFKQEGFASARSLESRFAVLSCQGLVGRFAKLAFK